MAKNTRKILTVLLSLTLIVGLIATPATAAFQAPATQNTLKNTEYIKANVNGSSHLVDKGSYGSHTWLIQGTYNYDIALLEGTNTLKYKIGKQTGSYSIPMPAGYEDYIISEVQIDCTFNEKDSTNSQSAQYDNAVIDIVITKVVNPDTGEEIEIPPVDPDPTEPEPTEPEPTEPEPTEPEPTEPEPTEPEPTEPEPTEPEPTEPEPTEPEPTEPEPTEPEPTEPEPTEPEPTEPEPTEPEPTEPEPTEPEPTEPEPTEPEPTEPEPTEPEPTEPEPTEPEPTEPEPTEPGPEPSPLSDDEPIADVPKTGDPSLLWAAVSALSAGGLALVNRKKKED